MLKTTLLWIGGALLGIALLFLLMPYIAIALMTIVYGSMFAALSIGQGSVAFALATALFAFGTRAQNAQLLLWISLGPIVGLGIASLWYGGPFEAQPDIWRRAEYGWALPLVLVMLFVPRAYVRWGGPLLMFVVATTPIAKAILIVKEATDWSSGLLSGVGVPVAIYVVTLIAFAAAALALGAIARNFSHGRYEELNWTPRILGTALLVAAVAVRWFGLVQR